MERFKDLSEQEKLVLTWDGVSKYIEIEKLFNNIPNVDRPIEPMYIEIPPPDLTFYYSKASEYTLSPHKEDIDALNTFFKNSDFHYEISEKGIKIARKGVKISWSLAREGDFTISEKKLYSPELAKTIKEDIKHNEESKENYEQVLDIYRKWEEETRKIADPIWEEYYEIQEKYKEFQNKWSIFKTKYLTLAKDYKEAMKFFKLAFDITKEAEDYIFNIYNVKEEENGKYRK